MEKFQRSWNILENVEELRFTKSVIKLATTEPNLLPEC